MPHPHRPRSLQLAPPTLHGTPLTAPRANCYVEFVGQPDGTCDICQDPAPIKCDHPRGSPSTRHVGAQFVLHRAMPYQHQQRPGQRARWWVQSRQLGKIKAQSGNGSGPITMLETPHTVFGAYEPWQSANLFHGQRFIGLQLQRSSTRPGQAEPDTAILQTVSSPRW